jgi:hypothetical protein
VEQDTLNLHKNKTVEDLKEKNLQLEKLLVLLAEKEPRQLSMD